MRAALTIACTLLALTWAATALAAHGSARAGTTPASWLTTTCTAITTLQHGVDGRWGGKAAVKNRAALIGLLDRDAADAEGVLAATTRAPAGVPNGVAIATALRGPATALRRYAVSARAIAKRGNVAAVALAARTGMQRRSNAAGAAFVHAEGLYPSPAFTAAIDQAPSCALVHG
jgi:hypothetical protein